MVTVTRRIEWDAAHRVLNHESKCATLHGHRYVAEVQCSATKLDDRDRVIDFGVIKAKIGGWIDQHWDHTTLVNNADRLLWDWCWADHVERGRRAPFGFNGEPTAETIAARLFGVAEELMAADGIAVESVIVWETPNCSAHHQRGLTASFDFTVPRGG